MNIFFNLVECNQLTKKAIINMKLYFALENHGLIKFKKLMSFMMNFYHKNSKLFMVIQIEQEKIATKISGTLRFYLNYQACTFNIILKNTDFLSKLKLQLRNVDSFICFQLKQPLQTLKYLSSGSDLNQKLQFFFKKGGVDDEQERYLKLVRTKQYINIQKRVQISKPLALFDFDFWQFQDNLLLHICDFQTTSLAMIISEFFRQKRTLNFTFHLNKEENQKKIYANGKLTESVSTEVVQTFKTKKDFDDLTIQRNIQGYTLQMLSEIFHYRDLVNIMFTQKSEFVFSFSQDDHNIYIKLIPKKEIKTQVF